MKTFLLVLGLLFLAQAGITAARFPVMPDPNDTARFKLYLVEVDTRLWAGSVIGSLFGCLGSWLLSLHLRTRQLQRDLAELRARSAGVLPGERNENKSV
jgi:H+/gluconate symporter-like permease